MKVQALLLVFITLFVGDVFAWKNPFQTQQNEVRERVLKIVPLQQSNNTKKAEEPAYNISLGSLFGIYVEPGIDPIDEFERKPFIYISKTEENEEGVSNGLTRKVRVKVLHRDSHYPNGKLEFPCQLLVCEWKKRLSPGTYDLWVQPRNNGDYYEPCRVSGSFTLEKPIIQKVEEIDGENDQLVYIQVSGLYFSITPKVYVYYTVIKNGNVIKIKQKCRIESKTIDRVTGASEGIFTFKKRENTSWALADENGQPLVEVKSKIARSSSTTAGNTYFSGVNFGYHPDPAFGDLDGDGDQDMLVGVFDGTFNYYENTGSATVPVFTQRTESANPFDSLDLSLYGCPWFADMDGDGDLDLLAGYYKNGYFQAGISYFQNTGSATNPVFVKLTGGANPFKSVKAHTSCNPMTADMDADGDLDLIFTCRDDNPTGNCYHKNIYFYVNSGTATNPEFKYQSDYRDHPFDDIDYGNQTTAALADLDHDDDYDLVVSDDGGKFLYFENKGTPQEPMFVFHTARTNPFKDFDIGESSAPTFVDLDGDGAPELVSGSQNGTLYCFKNTSQSYPAYWEILESESAFGEIGENDEEGGYTVPCFGDLDGDGDQDIVMGEAKGIFHYYLNTGDGTKQEYTRQDAANNPFSGFNVGKYSTPYLGDVDGDGDLDMITGYGNVSGNAGIVYFKNVGTVTSPRFEQQSAANNPFDGISLPKDMNPLLVDLDNDGDLDLTAGDKLKIVHYYKNNGTATNPVYKDVTGSDEDPFKLISTPGTYCTSTFGDTDKDGDLDMILSDKRGKLYYAINIGTKESPDFLLQDSSYSPLFGIDVGGYGTPNLVDVNNDGILDVISGNSRGEIIEIRSSIDTVISFY
jgi:VCBS repeat protein